MTTDLPASESARARLRTAQKAEATALREVEAADRFRQRARGTLDEADASLRAAQLELVRVSGFDRAALLLDLPVDKLRSALTVKRQRTAAAPSESVQAPR
jgi:hypothetical protein